MIPFGKEYSRQYDCLYHDKDYREECDFLERIFSRHKLKVLNILDLGCGTGSHALILAQRGYAIVGVDKSKHMLGCAKEKAKASGSRIRFVNGDISSIRLKERFDVIIAMFGVINYQLSKTALKNTFKTASAHLVPGGIFIFDCWNGNAVLSQRPRACIKEVRKNKKDKIIRLTLPAINAGSRTVDVRFKLLTVHKDRISRETNETHSVRFLFSREIRDLLKEAGFSKADISPFLKQGTALTDNDWNMSVIAKKKMLQGMKRGR